MGRAQEARAAREIDCVSCQRVEQGFFSTLSARKLAILTAGKRTVIYKKRQVIFYEGNQPFGLYCIFSGLVKVFKTCEDKGHRQIVRLAGGGELLGYRALLAEEPYAATAEAVADSEICFIEKAGIMETLAEEPAASSWVMKKLSRDLRVAEEKERDLVLKDARHRMAELLLLLDSAYGVNVAGKRRLKMMLTREEMAEIIGVATETAIRLLHELQKDRLLSLEAHAIVLVDPAALRTLVSAS